jgi:hypothetical protein
VTGVIDLVREMAERSAVRRDPMANRTADTTIGTA